MEGRETELDRTILEAIKDPLTHLVRNAVDHGIETPEDRVAGRQARRGRAARCAPSTRAARSTSRSPTTAPASTRRRSRRKALERGLVSPTQAAAHEPTATSSNLDLPARLLDGRRRSRTSPAAASAWTSSRPTSRRSAAPSTCTSRVGRGHHVPDHDPADAGDHPGADDRCAGGERYAVPQVSLLELVRLAGEHARGGDRAHLGRPGLPAARTCSCRWSGSTSSSAWCRCGDDRGRRATAGAATSSSCRPSSSAFGLVVDDVLDTEEIVVKPLGRHLKGIPVYAGATILGDGSVVLILDALALARRANVLATGAGVTAVEAGAEHRDPRSGARRRDRRRPPRGDPARDGHPARGDPAGPRSSTSAAARWSSTAGTSCRCVRISHAARRLRASPTARARASSSSSTPAASAASGSSWSGSSTSRRSAPAPAATSTTRRLVGSVVVGEKVVELLDMESAVLAADPHFYSRRHADAVRVVRRGGPGMSQLSTFHVGKYLFGVDVSLVQEVVRLQQMTPVPLATNEIAGLINLRGEVLTAIDLRARLGLPPVDAAATGASPSTSSSAWTTSRSACSSTRSAASSRSPRCRSSRPRARSTSGSVTCSSAPTRCRTASSSPSTPAASST